MVDLVDILEILIKAFILVVVIPIALGGVAGLMAAKFTGKTSTWKGTKIGLNLGCLTVPFIFFIGWLHFVHGVFGDATAWTLEIVLTVGVAIAGPIVVVKRSRDRY